jgi:membrane protein DedA with SNARE-associated domain
VTEPASFLLRHPYAVVCAVVLAEQLGLPLPATPFLMAAGALAGIGHVHLGAALALAVAASLAGDLAWYEAGRRRGGRILDLLCRISLEPDSCVRRTEDSFARHGARTLLVAKFVPGLSTLAPPMAGVVRMSRRAFVLLDAAGAALWAGAGLCLGYLFSNQIERATEALARVGGSVTAAFAALVLGWVAWKYVERRRVLRDLRVARISPQELRRKLAAGEAVVVVDLRHVREVEAEPEGVPGALRLGMHEIAARHDEIPRDRDVVLYCT